MRVWFIIKEGLNGFKRAPLATLITILTVALTLILLSIFILIITNLSSAFQKTYHQVQLEVFISPALSTEERQQLVQKIQQYPEVATVTYISPQTALKKFQATFGSDLIGVLDENPLPPSLEVTLKPDVKHLEAIDRLASVLNTLSGVDNVFYQREVIHFLLYYYRIGLLISAVIGVVFIVITIILIFNTIRLTIHGRRTIIEIMQLVGATNFFIKGPFVVEGILQGFLGSLLACGVVWGLTTIITHISPITPVFPPYFYAGIIGAGILLGFIGSYFSVNRYLKL